MINYEEKLPENPTKKTEKVVKSLKCLKWFASETFRLNMKKLREKLENPLELFIRLRLPTTKRHFQRIKTRKSAIRGVFSWNTCDEIVISQGKSEKLFIMLCGVIRSKCFINTHRSAINGNNRMEIVPFCFPGCNVNIYTINNGSSKWSGKFERVSISNRCWCAQPLNQQTMNWKLMFNGI